MRNLALDVLFVRAEEPRQLDVSVVDRQLQTFSYQCFDQRNHWALTQVVGARLEAQPKHPNVLASGPQYRIDRALDLLPIALKNRIQQRHFNVQLFSFVSYGAYVFRQTG